MIELEGIKFQAALVCMRVGGDMDANPDMCKSRLNMVLARQGALPVLSRDYSEVAVGVTENEHIQSYIDPKYIIGSMIGISPWNTASVLITNTDVLRTINKYHIRLELRGEKTSEVARFSDGVYMILELDNEEDDPEFTKDVLLEKAMLKYNNL
jgi:hypothetical protein